MAVPPNAIVFMNGSVPTQMDPYDDVDFLLNLDGATGVLESGEGVTSFGVAVTAEAAALGLTVGTVTKAPSQPTSTQIRFWLTVDPSFQSNAAFNGAGTVLGIEISITTNSSPARKRQRTCAVTVAQQ